MLYNKLYGEIGRKLQAQQSRTASHIIIIHPVEYDACNRLCTMEAKLLHTESFNNINSPTVMFAFHNPKYRFTNE